MSHEQILEVLNREDAKPFKDMLRDSHGMVFIKDNKDKIAWTNKRGFEELGLENSDVLIGKSPSDVFDFIPKNKYAKIDQIILKTKTAKTNLSETIFNRKTDLPQLIRIDKIPFSNKHGEALGVVTFVINISSTLDNVLDSYSKNIKYQQIRYNITQLISSLRNLQD